jgi:hypothetical protein
MKYAWIENTIIRDLTTGDPLDVFHPDIAKLFDTQVPDEAEPGDTFRDGVLTKKLIPEPVIPELPELPAFVPPTVSAIQYKMLFTSAERIASKKSTDPVIIDLQDLLNDPRTLTVNLALKSISDSLDYMTAIKLLAPGRKAEILTGDPR